MQEYRRPSSFSAWASLAVALVLVCALPAQEKSSGKTGQRAKETKMTDVFTRYWDPTPVTPATPPRPIQPVRKALSMQKAQPGPPVVLRRYVNDRRNSRAGGSLDVSPNAVMDVRWKAELRDGLYPSAVLAAGDRIVVHGPSLWMLLDTDGRTVASGPLGASELFLDPAHTMFFGANVAGLITGYNFSNGKRVFDVSLNYGGQYERPLLARHDRLLLAVGVKRDVDPHGPPPEESSIEVLNLGDPAAPRNWDQEGGPQPVNDLKAATRGLKAALTDEEVMLATRDRIFLANWNMDLLRAFTGDFSPVEIALDEAGNIYLTVARPGRQSLWLVTPQGELVYSFDLPPGVELSGLPVVVGYDHTAYLLAGRQILSIAPDGKLNWMRATEGQIAGAAATYDDLLLVSEGDSLTAWDAQGQRRVLYRFTGEQLAAAPALIGDGDLLLATQTRLYRLSRRR
jgi:hypothetical protein